MGWVIPPFSVARPFLFMDSGVAYCTWLPKRNGLWMHIVQIPKQIIYYLNRIILRPDRMIDSEIAPHRCNHIWLCKRSLDGGTLQLQNWELTSDVAQYVPALILLRTYNETPISCVICTARTVDVIASTVYSHCVRKTQLETTLATIMYIPAVWMFTYTFELYAYSCSCTRYHYGEDCQNRYSER